MDAIPALQAFAVERPFMDVVVEHFRPCELGARMWFYRRDFEVYLRRGRRHFHGRRWDALTIANVLVHEGKRNRGVFDQLLIDCEAGARLLKCDAVLLEGLWPDLVTAMSKRGYRVQVSGELQFDLLKPLNPL